jgi:hypothetical protein
VSGLIQARSACLRLLHRGRRYERERSPTKSRLEPNENTGIEIMISLILNLPSSTDALSCSSLGSVKLRIN